MPSLPIRRQHLAAVLLIVLGIIIATPEWAVASESEARAPLDSTTTQLDAKAPTAAERTISPAENVFVDYSQSDGAITAKLTDITRNDGSVTADIGMLNSRQVWYKVTLLPAGDVDFDKEGLLYDGENYYILIGPKQSNEDAIGDLPDTVTFNDAEASLSFSADRTLEAGIDPQLLMVISAFNRALGIQNLPTADFKELLNALDQPSVTDQIAGFTMVRAASDM